MSRRSATKTATVNLHGLKEFEARAKLNEILDRLPDDVKILKVVHGYHGGQVLLNMVRNEYFHYRIDYVQVPYANDGETWYYLKNEIFFQQF